MKNEIVLLKNNDKKELTDLEWIEEFYEFMQGEVPEGITLGKGSKINISKKKAFTIIWYLQEHMPVLPDRIDQCDKCGDLYDSYSSGYYSEKQGKHFCSYCDTYHNQETDYED